MCVSWPSAVEPVSLLASPWCMLFGSGCVIALAGFVSTGLLGIDSDAPKSRDVFFTIFLVGVGTCHMVVTAVALESDLVGADHGGGGALVFGLFSCLEKLANGMVIFTAQYVEDAISRHQVRLRVYNLSRS